MNKKIYKVAAAHVSPVFLQLKPTVDKVCSLIDEAADNGAGLIVFPETFIPAFPIWTALQAPIYNHDMFLALVENSIKIPGPEIEKIAAKAKSKQVFVSIGLNESTSQSTGCLWNTNIIIGDNGELLSHHRKIVPTFYEKLIWAAGDGAGLSVVETELGRLGALICGENTNPLARYSLIAQGEQVHISTYPPVWPTHDPETGQNYDIKRAIEIRAGGHSFEGKVFNIVASGYMDPTTRNYLASRDKEAGRILDGSPRGISMVVGPDGAIIGDTLQDEEGLLYANIDLSKSIVPKQYHDISGGYNRFDIFNLQIDMTRRTPLDIKKDPRNLKGLSDFDKIE